MALLIEIKVPDVGNVADIDVIDVLIKPGDEVKLEQTLAVLETDKASIDLPSSAAGTVQELFIKAGDKVSEGTLIATVLANAEADSVTKTEQPVQQTVAVPEATVAEEAAPDIDRQAQIVTDELMPEALAGSISSQASHATPAVRLYARELGVDIQKITIGSGRKGRILKDDVKNFVQQAMKVGIEQNNAAVTAMPSVDFSQFGAIEEQKLSKIKRLTGQNMSRVWQNLPMVTYHDEAEITEMEAFRNALNAEKNKDNLSAGAQVKITGLVFIIKAVVAAMEQFPQFNASLSADGEKLILKKYFNIGIAVDTPNGLVVPVLRNVNQKGIYELSVELAEKSNKARLGKLLPSEMQGGCITISSLGGIGGMAFTPIVNAPEVSILGVTRAKMLPVWDGGAFVPRLMLPLDLTYDHRVIDGVEGAKFMAAIKQYLGDIRRLLL